MRSLICVGSASKLRPSIPTENPPPAMLVASQHRNDSYLSGGQRLIRRVRKISPTQSVQVQQMAPNSSIQTSSNYHQAPVYLHNCIVAESTGTKHQSPVTLSRHWFFMPRETFMWRELLNLLVYTVPAQLHGYARGFLKLYFGRHQIDNCTHQIWTKYTGVSGFKIRLTGFRRAESQPYRQEFQESRARIYI